MRAEARLDSVFPAHWAPNDLALYDGHQFPNAYRGGAFIAFHGSWNRAPYPQEGYNVVFQPLADGKPSGKFVVFADGFAGAVKEPGRAAHRPSGLAVGPDGALYISDDAHGRIWRVTFSGGAAVTGIEAAPAPRVDTAAAANVEPPEGIHPDAGAQAAAISLPVPPGASQAQVVRGERVYHGQEGGRTCEGCHGSTAKGTPLAPDLTRGKWLWGNGSLAAIHAHDHRRRAEPQGIQERDASHGRRPALSFRSQGRRRLCMGAGPPEECPLTKGEIGLAMRASPVSRALSASGFYLSIARGVLRPHVYISIP